MINYNGLPSQKISWKRKNKAWRKKHIDWAEKYIWSNSSNTRKSFKNKTINHNLVNGILDMEDLAIILNPNSQKASYIPDRIQHYPIINSKLNILIGEESSRRFDYHLVVTNPNEISEIEKNRVDSWRNDLMAWATQGAQTEEESMRGLEKIERYNKYEWQDIREIRGNALLKHYKAELSIPAKINKGFSNALWSGEEVYQVDIVGGEPTFEVINPLKMEVLGGGSSTRIEDADMIVLWDYKSKGQIIDSYYDVLTDSDIKYLDSLTDSSNTDSMGNDDPTVGWNIIDPKDGYYGEGISFSDSWSPFNVDTNLFSNKDLVDRAGNIRELRLYWKSFRKILKVKSYNYETGDVEYNFYPEDHIINEDLGEESFPLWINEAWEATKIGKIYVNMRPRVVQYNRLSNPSRCHFGIIGSIYNINEAKPYSLVDMAKPYSYLYNVVHDRLNKSLEANWGKILKLDTATIPKGWEIEKWLYYAKVNKMAVVDSFKEGNKGASTGKLAGMLNNQSSGVIDAEQGNSIQNDINLLQFIKMEMGEAMGITPQREGQVSNRETVGGVERSVLQSSHITEWLFTIHDDVRKRALEAFLETAKIALKGKSLKFPYILGDGTIKIMDIDGDEFAECDYGLMIDNSNDVETFLQKMEGYAQALIQNQMITTQSLIKLWNGSSIAEITRSIEDDERKVRESQAQEMEMKNQQFQQETEARMLIEQEKLRIQEDNNIRDNETKLLIANINSMAASEDIMNTDNYTQEQKDELEEKIRQYNANLSLQKDKFNEEKSQNKINNKFKQQEIDIKKYQSRKTNQSKT